jgi:TonB family protein
MAHLPTLPDPSPQRNPHGQKTPPDSGDSKFSFTELTHLLGQHGAGSSSEDLALDLLLHEVVSQACSTTNAAAAAIALLRNDEFICRATAGKHAPDLGSRLSADSGLSGACVQAREVQRCYDTETDARVDAAACRLLGVRSVVVVPLLQEGVVVGVLETFSPHAHVFTDRDIETLLTLSRRILDTMNSPVEKEEAVSSAPLFDGNDAIAAPHKDPWTTVLAVLILILAILLGWMLGHKGLGKAIEKDSSAATVSASTKPATPANETSSLPTSVPSPAKNVASTPTTLKTPATDPGGLLVYENGKLVFQVKPAPASAHSEAVQVPEKVASTFLIERIEPQYPDPARLAHIQGSVVLELNVNEKGTVRDVRALSGDPQLAIAATEAVRQWRYKPYAPKGQALDFQTQATLDFKLP